MANTAVRITELDFDGIKNNLKNYLRSQSEFTDYDFEGSGMNVLLDILAYNTHYMGYYLNTVANEMFLDSAQMRNSILSLSKLTNYVPTSRIGAEAIVNVLVTPTQTENQVINILTVDKYTKLLGKDIDGTSYPFVAVNANTSFKTNGSFTFSNVHIKQGEVITQQFLMSPTNTYRRFELASANVDVGTILVSVQDSASNTTVIQYNLSDDITVANGNSAIYFVEENENLNYTIYFGDGILGKRPKDGSVITATYIDTSGSTANAINKFAFAGKVGGLFSSNVAVTTVQSAAGGAEKESVDTIKYRAPHAYTTQNRAVTKMDYENLLIKDYPNIGAVSVWGGEEYDPPVFGKLYISLKTKGNYGLSNFEKERIKSQLITNRNVVTVIPEIIDPDYVYIVVKSRVSYNPSLTGLTSNQILPYVQAAIYDYTNEQLNRFDSVLRKSKLQYYMENAEKSITGSDVQVYLQKRVALDTNVTKNYTIHYDLPLRKGDFLVKLTTFPAIKVIDVLGVEREVFIEETPQSFTGVDDVLVINPGKGYNSTPTITITGDGVGAAAEATVVNGAITKIMVTNKGTNYTRATVTISDGAGTEATAVAKLQSRYGTLRTAYYKPSGEKVVVNDYAGTIDYTEGTIFLQSLYTTGLVKNSYYDTDVLTISVPSNSEIINPLRNRIMTLDINDPNAISIEMIPES